MGEDGSAVIPCCVSILRKGLNARLLVAFGHPFVGESALEEETVHEEPVPLPWVGRGRIHDHPRFFTHLLQAPRYISVAGCLRERTVTYDCLYLPPVR